VNILWLAALAILYVTLALLWQASPPARGWQIALGVFALLGLTPTIAALLEPGRLSLASALREGAILSATLDAHRITGPIVTLSPEILPATGRLPDARFAAGPFYFRSRTLLDEAAERRLHVVARDRMDFAPGTPILTGAENAAAAGDPALDAALATAGGRAIPVPGTRFRLYLTPPAAASPPAAPHNSRPVPPHARGRTGHAPPPPPPHA
jgi:hypothetical protein